MKKDFLILGHYAKNKDAADGQTVKTRSVYNLLSNNKYKISIIDTYKWRLRFPIILIQLFTKSIYSRKIVFLLSNNGLKYLLPILVFIKKFFKKELYYIVIGAWLCNLIDENKSMRKNIKYLNNVLVETSKMQECLSQKYKIKSSIFVNIRDFKIHLRDEESNEHFPPYKLCIFSRIMEEKGILDALIVVDNINKTLSEPLCTIDIYGTIDNDFSDKFHKHLAAVKNAKYCGVVKQHDVISILSGYYLILFPTRFYTEGIPGTIIDGFFSNVPTLASKWENYADVINDNINGFLYEYCDIESFEKKLLFLLLNPNVVEFARENLSDSAKKYTFEYNNKIIKEGLNI